MKADHKSFLRNAYDRYLDNLESEGLQPIGALLSYDFEFLENRKWHTAGNEMVSSDIRELTNILNGWSQLLLRWHAWNRTLSDFDEVKTWELRQEFVDSMVHECLLKPSAIRDTFTEVATSAFHQVRLSVDESYADRLEGDPTPEQPFPRPLSRKNKENRLARLVSIWTGHEQLLDALYKINSKEYIDATLDYRNRNSHTIGPRIGIGYTRLVKRAVVPAETLVPASDGTFNVAVVPGKMMVSYGIGGTPPLDLEEARIANLKQYRLARAFYVRYRNFLEYVVSNIPADEQGETNA